MEKEDQLNNDVKQFCKDKLDYIPERLIPHFHGSIIAFTKTDYAKKYHSYNSSMDDIIQGFHDDFRHIERSSLNIANVRSRVINFFLPHLKQKENDAWISVEDRLPKHNDAVLFYTTWATIEKGSFLETDEWNRKNLFCSGAFFVLSKVTHWMLLPKSPTIQINK